MSGRQLSHRVPDGRLGPTGPAALLPAQKVFAGAVLPIPVPGHLEFCRVLRRAGRRHWIGRGVVSLFLAATASAQTPLGADGSSSSRDTPAGAPSADTSAETCTRSPTTCGKEAFEAGIRAYQAGKYATALRLFRDAHQLRPHPTILYNVALAEAKVGQLIEAVEHLDQVFEDPATPGDLLERARLERDQVAAKIASITAEDEGARLRVDGAIAAGHPPTRMVNPGRHHVELSISGRVAVDREVAVRPGERLRLSVATASGLAEPIPPEPDDPASPGPEQPSAAAAPDLLPSEPEQSRREIPPVWVYVGGGLTLGLGGLTLWSGLDTRRAFLDYEEGVGSLSRSAAAAQRDAGRGKQLRTNILIGATAVAGLATTAVAVLVVDWSKRGHGGDKVSPSVSFVVSPQAVSLRARF